MAQAGAPYSYSFEGQKTDVPLNVDAASGPDTSQVTKSRKEVRGVERYRRGGKRKRH